MMNNVGTIGILNHFIDMNNHHNVIARARIREKKFLQRNVLKTLFVIVSLFKYMNIKMKKTRTLFEIIVRHCSLSVVLHGRRFA